MEKSIVAYLGPDTYTERALELYNPDFRRISFPTIETVFRTLAANDVEYGFVPIENRIDGLVNETLDALLANSARMQIIDAVVMPVEHAIGALASHRDITQVLSKGTAIRQCSRYMDANYPLAQRVEVDNTAAAMKMIADRAMQDSAAIGMESSFSKYGLEVIETNIGNRKDNKTRFILLGNSQTESTGRDVTTLSIYPKRDRVGWLEDLVKLISKKYGLNMSSIHSRPEGLEGFRFYIDLQGHQSEDKTRRCIEDIGKELADTEVTVLGSCRYAPFCEPLIKTIGIIGGTGKMGSWFKPFYEALGYKILVGSRFPDGKTGVDYESCVKDSDAVIVNVPIEVTPSVIRQIGPLMRKGQLLVDNTGVKTHVVNAMENSTNPDVELLSIHTFFGEKILSLDRENITSIHTRFGKMAQEFEDLLYKYGAITTEVSSPDEHDRYAILTQGLEHVCSVVKQATIINRAGHPVKLSAFLTPSSRIAHTSDGRIHSNDSHLLAVMLRENPNTLPTLRFYHERMSEIIAGLEKGDASAFQEMMDRNKDTLGPEFLKQKTDQSKQVDEQLKKS